MRLLIYLLASLALSCGPTMKDPRLGDADPAADRRVVEAFKAKQQVPDGAVLVPIDTVPGGNTSDGGIQVQAGYAHERLGKFDLCGSEDVLCPVEGLVSLAQAAAARLMAGAR
jgi:hypothetical protein